MSKATFQSIILKLQNFWAERGCVLWQPYLYRTNLKMMGNLPLSKG
jgi:glycyl-tRNA synthetase alpha subunit